MKEPYFMNKVTGELEPYSVARELFYQKHRNWNESIFDEWEETNILSDVDMAEPDFKAIMI